MDKEYSVEFWCQSKMKQFVFLEWKQVGYYFRINHEIIKICTTVKFKSTLSEEMKKYHMPNPKNIFVFVSLKIRISFLK